MKYFLILCLFFLFSCKSNKTGAEKEKSDAIPEGTVAVVVKDFKGLDGCSFLLQVNDTLKLEPVELADSLKQDGLNLHIKYQKVKDYMSICMAGMPVRITEAYYR